MASIVIHSERFEGEVAGLRDRCRDFSRPLRQWLVHMTGSVKLNFDAQGRPVKWAPVKVATLIARYLRTKPALKLAAKGRISGGAGRLLDYNPAVYRDDVRGVGAISTIRGFARSEATGRILRARHKGMNKIAPAGISFRAKLVQYVEKGMILQDNGTLMASITSEDSIEAGAFKGELGTNLKYARAHQFGYPEGGLVRRPFVIIQDEDVPILEDLIVRQIRGEGGAV